MEEKRMYLATIGSYSDYTVIGIFSTIEKAILAIKNYDEDSYIHCDWNVRCIHLDVALD